MFFKKTKQNTNIVFKLLIVTYLVGLCVHQVTLPTYAYFDSQTVVETTIDIVDTFEQVDSDEHPATRDVETKEDFDTEEKSEEDEPVDKQEEIADESNEVRAEEIDDETVTDDEVGEENSDVTVEKEEREIDEAPMLNNRVIDNEMKYG
ncbi:hypothetical protein [Paracerasibacillus soli]|uniref:Uncharacterized protein n=1 Tax=Paracerasibacillus soli TaxID=480284 RepID=A0ABU5CTX7_9BACI|nr:hypothetical protein [Virgibacillus soli]MDY0409302.1 hypothetical protein [Virgibacillus soli]